MAWYTTPNVLEALEECQKCVTHIFFRLFQNFRTKSGNWADVTSSISTVHLWPSNTALRTHSTFSAVVGLLYASTVPTVTITSSQQNSYVSHFTWLVSDYTNLVQIYIETSIIITLLIYQTKGLTDYDNWCGRFPCQISESTFCNLWKCLSLHIILNQVSKYQTSCDTACATLSC